MNTVPVAYLEHIELVFDDGRVWEINIKSQLQNYDAESIADKLLDALSEFKDEIVKIDFKVDIEKLKQDINTSTKGIF